MTLWSTALGLWLETKMALLGVEMAMNLALVIRLVCCLAVTTVVRMVCTPHNAGKILGLVRWLLGRRLLVRRLLVRRLGLWSGILPM